MTSARVLLPGFEYRRIDIRGVTISCAVRGSTVWAGQVPS
jgi:hypothetical protein